MHVYIYDSYLNQPKYQKTLSRIETRITDLGLNGKISRLGLMKNVNEVVQSEIRRGAKTIVVVGNDDTVQQVINSIARTGVPLGIIPIDKKNNLIAERLGIPCQDDACDILSARRIEQLDLGLANDQFFLTHAAITGEGTRIEVKENYSIELKEPGEIYVFNLDVGSVSLPPNVFINPSDGLLQVALITKHSKKFLFSENTVESIFAFDKFRLVNQKKPILLDGLFPVSSPVEISISRNSLKVIVGKNRSF